MNEADKINILRSESEEYKKLETQHRKLEQFLDTINKKKHLTTEEELEKKQTQKQKLQYKDRMAELIREYKN